MKLTNFLWFAVLVSVIALFSGAGYKLIQYYNYSKQEQIAANKKTKQLIKELDQGNKVREKSLKRMNKEVQKIKERREQERRMIYNNAAASNDVQLYKKDSMGCLRVPWSDASRVRDLKAYKRLLKASYGVRCVFFDMSR